MKDYFSANQLHLPDKVLLAGSPHLLATYGSDNILFTINPLTQTQEQYQFTGEENFSGMTISPDGSHCLFISKSSIKKYVFESKSFQNFEEQICMGDITVLRYSSSGKFLGVGTQDGKPLVLNPLTRQIDKCRPGHLSAVVNLFISPDEKYLASIGQDQNLLVYNLTLGSEPMQQSRYPITDLTNCQQLCGSFHLSKLVIFAPGQRYLQTIHLLNNKWEYKRVDTISHGDNIIMLVQAFKQKFIVTSSEKEVCIWNIVTQEKIFQVEEFSLNMVVPVSANFYGTRDDGILYRFTRELKDEEPMEIQEKQDEINFEVESGGEEQQEQKISLIEYKTSKKSTADRLITCLPQGPITFSTSWFEQQRFLFVNQYGCVIQRQEGEEQNIIEVQFGLQNPKKMTLAHNRTIQFFDLNPFALVYASQKEFGTKLQTGSEGQSWQRPWNGIRNIACGVGWLAVANEEQIKILDMCCHQIRTIAFDRDIVALKAHQNILCIVYHEGVPMFGSQQLAMQLILVNTSIRITNMLSTVAVSIKPESVLRSIHFSKEGMLFSQDSSGTLRAFSLERGDWTPVAIVGTEDSRKAWVIGAADHQLIYWKTSNEDPEPTVAPRFSIKSSSLYIPTVGQYPEGTQQAYQQLLWQRFSLDHEKARSRLWGKLKMSRPSNNIFYFLVNTIKSQKQIAVQQQELDEKYFNIIQTYLKADQPLRALFMAKSCLRSIDSIRKAVQLFDYYNKRNIAIQLEQYCEQIQKQIDYQEMQIFEFEKMRQAAQRVVKPASDNPMKRGSKRINQSIPSFSQNISQESVEGSIGKINSSQASQVSKISAPSQQQQQDPFAKNIVNNSGLDTKKRQIFDHVEKYGIKKKVEEKGNRKNKV